MHDIERRIRDSKPEAGALPEVDVQALVRRAQRRTMAARLSTGLAAVVLVAGAAVTVDQLRPRSSVEIGLVSPATTGQPSAGAAAVSPSPDPTPTRTPPKAQGEILARPTPGEAVEAGPGGPAAPVCAIQAAPDGLGTVALGTGDGITVEHAAADLRDPEAWRLDGGVSALAALAGADEQLIFTVGERPSCGSPMPPAPEQLANLTRLAVQPPPDEGCEDWFAVDLYVDDDGTGRIRAVTIDTAP